MKRLIVAINGINTIPGDSDNWTGKLVTFVNSQWSPASAQDGHLVVAEKIEYFRTALTRWIFQKEMTHKIEKTLRFYDDFDHIDVAVHSNGANAITKALWARPTLKIRRLDIFSGACPADFYGSNLNLLLLRGQVEKIRVWVAGNDWALRCAAFGKFIGFGQLGLKGPKNCLPEFNDRVEVRTEPKFGHSEWFSRENIQKTMIDVCVY